MAGRPLIFKSAEELQTAIDAYFAKCDKLNEPYTISGLAYDMGIDRKTLLNYSKRDEFFPTIKKARDKVEVYVEKLMLKSSGVVAGVIFNAKNNFDWKDKSEVEVSGGFEETRKKQKEEYAKLNTIRNNGKPTDPSGNPDTPA